MEFNVLCLCPNCHALMKHGGRDLKSVLETAEKVSKGEVAPEEVGERRGDFYIINVKVAGKEREIFYKQTHMAKFIQQTAGKEEEEYDTKKETNNERTENLKPYALGFKTSNKREKYAQVLDHLPNGHPDGSRSAYQKKPLVQAIGEDKFILMELSPKENVIPTVYDRVYIGEGERDVIDHVIRRLRYNQLTPSAKKELPNVLERIVKEDEKKFIALFNNPKGILKFVLGGKMSSILGERGKGEFTDFDDLTKRVRGLRHPEMIIVSVILDKIVGGKQKDIEALFND